MRQKIKLLIREGAVSNVHPNSNVVKYTFDNATLTYVDNYVLVSDDLGDRVSVTPYALKDVLEIIILN